MKVSLILTIFLYFNLIEGYKQLNQKCRNICVHEKCMGNDNFCEIYYTESKVESDNESLVFVSNCRMVPIDMKIRNPNDFYECER